MSEPAAEAAPVIEAPKASGPTSPPPGAAASPAEAAGDGAAAPEGSETPASPIGPVIMISAMVAGIALLFISPAICLFMAVAMMPTLITAITGRGGTRVQTMASMNLAGALPSTVKIWKAGNTTAAALAALVQPSTMVLIVAAALFGGILLWIGPYLAARAMTFANRREAEKLVARNGELESQWGDDLVEDSKRLRAGNFED